VEGVDIGDPMLNAVIDTVRICAKRTVIIMFIIMSIKYVGFSDFQNHQTK